MFTPRTLLGVLAVFLLAARAVAGTPALIEVQAGKHTLQGKIVANNDQLCWLMAQDGRLQRLDVSGVKNFRQISPSFRSWSPQIMRDQLRKEFGRQFEFGATRHYLVCATKEAKAKQYAEVLEDIYNSFHHYFSVRGFKLPEPEFPLVAVVFPDQAAFGQYARKDGVQSLTNLKGYYINTTNRIAAFEEENHEGSLRDTLVHEATHQTAFNAGLHTRVGINPKWVAEGLATVFEAPGIRNSTVGSNPKTRINTERLIWFGSFSKSRRKEKSLEEFIASDAFFETSQLDAYSQAWALTFFLVETRPREYAKYLAAISARNPLQNYSSEARVADFKHAFGNEIALLEAEMLRFIAGVK